MLYRRESIETGPSIQVATTRPPREVAALLANGAMDVVVGAETFDNPSLKRMKVVQDHLIVAARWPPSRHPAADSAAELPSC